MGFMFRNYPDFTRMIHKDGYSLILIFIVATVLFNMVHETWGFVAMVATVWCIFFFRNPDRCVPMQDGLVLSAADGIVQSVGLAVPPEELNLGEEEMLRVSVFLSVFNVHVNRIPLAAKVVNLTYHSGRFINASLDKASIHNERQSILLETKDGVKIGVVQIAGLIARRIVCDLEEKMEVAPGDRFGIIRFGSRVDLYLPQDVQVLVAEGQTAIGGETVIAKLNSNTVANEGTLTFVTK